MSNTAIALLDQEQNLKTLTQLALINMPAGSTYEDANRLITKEIVNMKLLMDVRPELKVCSQNSIFNAVKQCINDNLSLSPSAGLVYLYPTQVTVGMDGANQPIKEWVVNYDPNANGRISIARQTGAILDHKRPSFEFDAVGALDKVHLEILLPSWGHPRWERITFDKRSFAKWRKAAESKYGGKTPAAYTALHGGIDPEFAASKAVRHGLNRLGTNTNEKRHQIQPNKETWINMIDPKVALSEAALENNISEFSKEMVIASVDTSTGEIQETINISTINAADL